MLTPKIWMQSESYFSHKSDLIYMSLNVRIDHIIAYNFNFKGRIFAGDASRGLACASAHAGNQRPYRALRRVQWRIFLDFLESPIWGTDEDDVSLRV